MRNGVSFVVAVVVFAACSSNKPNPSVPPAVPVDPGSLGDAGDLDAGVGEGGVVDAGPVSSGPTFFTGDGGGLTPPSIGEAALDSTIDVAMTTASAKVAPKMEKEGQPGRATLKEGEHFGMVVTLMPNRCYTIVGFSPPGNVTQLDLKLYGPLPLNAEAGKSGKDDKAAPVIGKGANALCPVLPLPASYKIDATALKGTGRIGINVYARNR